MFSLKRSMGYVRWRSLSALKNSFETNALSQQICIATTVHRELRLRSYNSILFIQQCCLNIFIVFHCFITGIQDCAGRGTFVVVKRLSGLCVIWFSIPVIKLLFSFPIQGCNTVVLVPNFIQAGRIPNEMGRQARETWLTSRPSREMWLTSTCEGCSF